MKIKNAIIIHGPGRSGTTLLNSIMSSHPKVAWISSWINRFPQWYWLSVFNKFRNKKDGSVKLPKPTEAYHFWTYYLPEFNQEHPDFDTVQIQRLQKVLMRLQRIQGKPKLLIKLTGAARFEFIDAVFEAPKIVWLDRKPESVVMSYFKQRWGYKNKPELFASKNKQELIKEYFEKYRQFHLQKKALTIFDVKEMAYEELVSSPMESLKELCDFFELPFNELFRDEIKNRAFRLDTNKAYLDQLNETEIQYLNELVRSL